MENTAKKINYNFDTLYNMIFRWINRHLVISYFLIFLGFILFAGIQNWSLLVGENLMKWDIWQAEYPLQVLMSDALDNQTIPMWNPLMQFGTPNYAIVGSPIWYPVTMLLACTGYTPITVAMSYVIHIAIGGFGMFLLVGKEIKRNNEKWQGISLSVSIIAGLLYSTSGIFLSNAQHIMIFISASWIPYIFYFMRNFIEKNSIIFAMLAGLCAGLIFVGGYPEIFYNLFLFLIPYVMYFNYKKNKGVLINIIYSAKKYIILVIFTVCASSISLIPFLKNMGLITRGNGFGQIPNNYTVATLLSMLFSRTSQFIQGTEVSMVNYYMGIITILLMPMIILRKYCNKKLYTLLAICAFLLCWGKESFLHSFFYRFLPMYNSFRFPTLNRIFLIVFFLLLFSAACTELLEKGIDLVTLKYSKLLLCIVSMLAIVSSLVVNIAEIESPSEKLRYMAFSESAYKTAVIIFLYILVFSFIKNEKGNKKKIFILLFLIVCTELLTYAFAEGPITITQYGYTEYMYNPAVQESVKTEFQKNSERNRSVDFSGQVRSTSGLDSQAIVFNKTFDEEGYLSYLLQSISDFKLTYRRSIMEQNPVIYFTNDIVTPEEVDYEQWKNTSSVPPEQIYVEESLESKIEVVDRLSPKIVSQTDLELMYKRDSIVVKGNLYSTQSKTGRVRLFLENSVGGSLYLNLKFIEESGTEQIYAGEYEVYNLGGEKYIDIYFPHVNMLYQSIEISTNELPMKAQLIVTERMAKDFYTDVKKFGFNDIILDVDIPTEGYIVILQAKHEGWSVYVDGEKSEIELVNNCFMGIHLGAGEHSIELHFRPKDFFVGLILTISYIISIFAMLLRFLYLNRK